MIKLDKMAEPLFVTKNCLTNLFVCYLVKGAGAFHSAGQSKEGELIIYIMKNIRLFILDGASKG